MLVRGKEKPKLANNQANMACIKANNYERAQNSTIFTTKSSTVYKSKNIISSKKHEDQLVAIEVISQVNLYKRWKDQRLNQLLKSFQKMDHPNILKQLDYYQDGGNFYWLSEFCEEGSLADLISSRKRMSQAESKNYIIDIYNGLLYLEQQNIKNITLRPSKIYIHQNRAKVSPFSVQLQENQSYLNEQIEELVFLAPEQMLLQRLGPKTVVWSFGVLIYQILYSKSPFGNFESQMELTLKLLNQVDETIFENEVSKELKQLILKCLTIDEDQRPTLKDLKKLSFFSFVTNQQSQSYLQQSQQIIGNAQLTKNDCLTKNTNSFTDLGVKQFINDITDDWRNTNLYSKNTIWSLQLQDKIDLTTQDRSKQMWKAQSQKNINVNTERLSTKSLISAVLTQNQIIKVLHYCRLVYKSIQLIRSIKIKEEHQLTFIKTWLLQLLQSLREQMQNPQTKRIFHNHKLPSVIQSYYLKYSQEFGNIERLPNKQANITYKKMSGYFESMTQKIVQQIKQTIQKQKIILAHYIVVIYYATTILEKCFIIKDYSAINGLTQMQSTIKKSYSQMSHRTFYNLLQSCHF